MAKVSGRCPNCNEVIPVNDERKTGHCVKCGTEINVLESIKLFQMDAGKSSKEQPSDAQRQIRRSERAKEAERKEVIMDATRRIEMLFQLCTNETDFLMIRPNIMKMDLPDEEKAALLVVLDQATSVRLKETMEKAKSYASSQESPVSAIVGCLFFVGVGFAINYFFSMVWPGRIGIALAALGLFGLFSERFDKKKHAENRAAAELIDQYIKLGYKLQQ